MAPVLAGAVAPDLPMFLFYAVEKLLLTTPERLIWSTRYFDAGWQDFFDVFNSLPLIGLGLIVAVALRRRGLQLFFASMALHALCDLLLHHEDAHRHLFPFLDWRFASPISYWDPRHYGRIAAPLEAAVAFAGCALLARRYTSRGARIAIGVLAVVYAAFLAFAVLMWVS